jgi:hypothetical protein
MQPPLMRRWPTLPPRFGYFRRCTTNMLDSAGSQHKASAVAQLSSAGFSGSMVSEIISWRRCMNDKLEMKKKKQATEIPVHVIRQGGVAASIWQRCSPAGFEYFDYSLTRSWKSKSSGSIGYSKNFFVRNQQELISVIQQASQWIMDHETKGLTPEAIAA